MCGPVSYTPSSTPVSRSPRTMGCCCLPGWLWHPFVAGRRQLGEAGSGTGKGGKAMTAGGYTLGPRWGARLRRARPAVADGREASVADDRLSDGCKWIRNVGVVLPGPYYGHPRPPGGIAWGVAPKARHTAGERRGRAPGSCEQPGRSRSPESSLPTPVIAPATHQHSAGDLT